MTYTMHWIIFLVRWISSPQTGITLSNEQYKEFKHRIEQEHLEQMVTVELMDYRDLPDYGHTFDRVVSVGMVEHVGRDNYQLFLDCAKKVLNPGGLFLLHFISALKEHPGDPWIKKYIFPGGVIPSLREMVSCAATFHNGIIDLHQILLTNGINNNLPIVRWY